MLLSVVFITCIPNMLNAGNNIGTIKKALSDALKFRVGREKAEFLFIRYAIKIDTIATRLKQISSGTVDSGDL